MAHTQAAFQGTPTALLAAIKALTDAGKTIVQVVRTHEKGKYIIISVA